MTGSDILHVNDNLFLRNWRDNFMTIKTHDNAHLERNFSSLYENTAAELMIYSLGKYAC